MGTPIVEPVELQNRKYPAIRDKCTIKVVCDDSYPNRHITSSVEFCCWYFNDLYQKSHPYISSHGPFKTADVVGQPEDLFLNSYIQQPGGDNFTLIHHFCSNCGAPVEVIPVDLVKIS